MKKVKTINIIIIIGIIYVFVVPFSFALYKNMFIASGNLISSDWNVSLNQNGVNNYISIVPDPNGTSASYNLNVTSNSEVDVIYSIIVDDLPSGVSVKLDNGSFIQETNNKVIFSDVGTILYSDSNKTKTHTLTFIASQSTQYVSEKEINVDVLARQTLLN